MLVLSTNNENSTILINQLFPATTSIVWRSTNLFSKDLSILSIPYIWNKTFCVWLILSSIFEVSIYRHQCIKLSLFHESYYTVYNKIHYILCFWKISFDYYKWWYFFYLLTTANNTAMNIYAQVFEYLFSCFLSRRKTVTIDFCLTFLGSYQTLISGAWWVQVLHVLITLDFSHLCCCCCCYPRGSVMVVHCGLGLHSLMNKDLTNILSCTSYL